ncbi:hypothetical protein LIQ46_01615 [Megasphaera elsdenii]|uniref:hypothetical protein n=1 Tax=Megasphaera elsdenii TaxID=907 RepID=UPI001D00B6DA|nr:hypothetical protein [Megasphaera elsdenii]MCB5701651.1 hypothetical protein [Megasphaera elsdenii]MCB5726444.1 hypothetical protein [Megasphaera elsdenii]MCB5770223.1 hypothetical protein [Megasphaera elsdenii]
MNLTKFSIDRPIGIAMVIAFFVVLGLFSFYRIGVELLPALNTPLCHRIHCLPRRQCRFHRTAGRQACGRCLVFCV